MEYKQLVKLFESILPGKFIYFKNPDFNLRLFKE